MKKNTKYLIITFLFLCNYSFAKNTDNYVNSNTYHIEKYSDTEKNISSGDLQTANINTYIEKPLQVIVLDENNKAVPNTTILFKFQSVPQQTKGNTLSNKSILTDSLGIAKTNLKLGDKKGRYSISASIKSINENNFVIFQELARKSNWVFILIISLMGGLGLFLFGMFLMSEGLQKSAGDKMRTVLSRLTNNKLVALAFGTFVTMVIQSSSATTVMLVSFVHAKLISFRKTLSIILGSGIGTTITAQLIAFKLSEYSLLVVAVGFALYYFTKTDKLKNIGESLFGFGILFYGMDIMSEAMYPLRTYQPFLDFIVHLENPFFGIIVGMIFTALIQSSGAFIGILIILSSQGFITIEAGIPLIIGSNVGTAITAIFASIGTNREAIKVAIAHTSFKIFGVLIFIWWMPSFGDLVVYISPKGDGLTTDINILGEFVPRQLANAHTIFNVVLTLFALPFTKQFAWAINKVLPKKTEVKNIENKTSFIDTNLIKTPSLALNLAKQETIQMAYLVRTMLAKIMIPFTETDSKIIDEIENSEKQVNFLRDELNKYLIKISKYNIKESRVSEAFQILYTVKELEQIADIISTSLSKKAKSWVNNNHEFSAEGLEELTTYHTSSLKQLSRAIEVFRDVNLEKANHVNKKFKKYENMAFEFEKKHYERLVNQVAETLSSSKTHLLLMDMFKQISEHSTNIARILLKWSEEKQK